LRSTELIQKAQWLAGKQLGLDTHVAPLSQLLQPHSLPEGTSIHAAGSVYSDVLFLLSGIMRCSYTHNGKDFSADFFAAKGIFLFPLSFLYNMPSTYSLETYTDCDFCTLERSTLQAEHLEIIQALTLKIAIPALQSNQTRFLQQMYSTPEQKYLWFSQTYPQIVEQVPQAQIASLLGITPVSLSRIRRRISEKNRVHKENDTQ
jgi:CRP-like cAMP-binding protein